MIMFDSTSLLVAALAGQALAAPKTLNWKRQSTQQPLLTDLNVISQYWGEYTLSRPPGSPPSD